MAREGADQASANVFRYFSGRTLTMVRAGLALNMISSPVKGLTPLRALVAGFFTVVIFIRPGTVNSPTPFLLTLREISDSSSSSTDDTCLRFRPVVVAISV